jgi:hypothetical protein
MTANELIGYFNEKFGLKEWPKTYEVDAETYGYCCQAVFDWTVKNYLYNMIPGVGFLVEIKLGQNNGLMFKNAELILKRK